ncbi:unnamed protein product [Closterium sp. NIES-54]
MLPSKDINFVGYTYRNMEIVQETHSPLGGALELKKKSKGKKPGLNSLFAGNHLKSLSLNHISQWLSSLPSHHIPHTHTERCLTCMECQISTRRTIPLPLLWQPAALHYRAEWTRHYAAGDPVSLSHHNLRKHFSRS